MPDRLEITTFGGYGVKGLTAPIRSRNANALLAFLTTIGSSSVRREELAGLLWDPERVSRARHSLSQLLYDLRRALPPQVLITSANTVSIHLPSVAVDHVDFNAAIESGDLTHASELYKGRFLDGFPYVSDEFDDWRIGVAARMHAEATGVFKALLGEALDEENYARAAALAKAALILSPLDPSLIKTRVESLAAAGEVGRALRELELARSTISVELGHVPSELAFNLQTQLADLAIDAQPPTSGALHVRLVGRTEELLRIRNHSRLLTSGVRLVSISGEPGIGKSRLVEHIIRRSVLDGDRVFTCRCSQAESKLPYGAIVNLVKSMWRSDDAAQMESSWASILATVAPELFPNASPAHGCSQRALWEATAHFFIAASKERRLVLAIDNFEWIDEVSKDVIRYVTKRLSEYRVFVVIAFRGFVDAPVYEDDVDRVLRIELRELDPVGTNELIMTAAEQYSIAVTPDLWQILSKRIGGRPYYLLEVLRQFTQSPPSRFTTLQDLQLPRSLERHLDERLREVPSEAMRVLDAIAVLGRPTSLQFLSRVTGLSPVTIASTAESLISKGILAESSDAHFSHDLLREAQRRRISTRDLRLWHARIAEGLSAASDPRASEVAFHFEEAGEPVRALQFATTARNEALSLHAYAEADEQFKRILRCSRSEDREHAEREYVKWLAKCARLGDIAVLPRAASLLKSNDAEASLAVSLAHFAQLERTGDASPSTLRTAALQIVDNAHRYAPSLLMTALWQVTDTLRRHGDFALLSKLASIVRQQAQAGPPELATEMLSVSALLTALSSGYAAAIPTIEQAVANSETIGDPMLIAKALYTRGTICVWAGRISDASVDYERVERLADPVGPDDLIERMRVNSSVILMEKGELAQAERQAILALRSTPGARRGYVYGNLCLIALQKGDVEEARKYARALHDWNRGPQHPWLLVNADALIGLADLMAGDLESAKVRAIRIRELLEREPALQDVLYGYLLIARVAMASGATSDTVPMLRDAARRMRKRDRLAGARLDLERARHYRNQGMPRGTRIATKIAVFARSTGAQALEQEALSLHQVT